jgi:hypothetical protein
MKTQRRSQPLTLALALMFLTFSLGMRTEAQTENLLFSFGDNSGGYAPPIAQETYTEPAVRVMGWSTR